MIYFEVSQNNKFSQTLGSLPACDPIAHEELEKGPCSFRRIIYQLEQSENCSEQRMLILQRLL